eukprot:jgi/Ulvmu1/10103/UM006_0053.1
MSLAQRTASRSSSRLAMLPESGMLRPAAPVGGIQRDLLKTSFAVAVSCMLCMLAYALLADPSWRPATADRPYSPRSRLAVFGGDVGRREGTFTQDVDDVPSSSQRDINTWGNDAAADVGVESGTAGVKTDGADIGADAGDMYAGEGSGDSETGGTDSDTDDSNVNNVAADAKSHATGDEKRGKDAAADGVDTDGDAGVAGTAESATGGGNAGRDAGRGDYDAESDGEVAEPVEDPPPSVQQDADAEAVPESTSAPESYEDVELYDDYDSLYAAEEPPLEAEAKTQAAAADADASGSQRTAEEVATVDKEACEIIRSVGSPSHVRIHHSTAPVPGVSDAAANETKLGATPIDADDYPFPFQIPENPGSMTFEDVQWCPGSLEEPQQPVDPSYRALFVVGAQKAGTTWLSQALSTHPSIVYGISHLETKVGPTKELQFFNTWPAHNTSEFLAMWPEEALARMRTGKSHEFLFDGSPEYLLNAAVPPRIKQMVPQAKIVIILRDPTDRAFSAWSMISSWDKFCDDPDTVMSALCVERTFQETFNAWHNSFARPECRFTTPGANVTWQDCFGCRYNLFRYRQCCDMREEHENDLFPCFGVPRGFSVLDYSNYAAQIAWWLNFFPPEQIYVVTSDVLKDHVKRVKVLDSLLDFVGLPDAPRFDAARVNRASSFDGKYDGVSDADIAAKDVVRRFHASQLRDLRALLARFFPAVDTSYLAGAAADMGDKEEDYSDPL